MENSSGHGAAATVPAEIDKWNWGAFLLNWIWGVGNKTYISLLMFIPLVNLVLPFVLGVKGSTWAWRNRKWDSVEHFQATQRNWTKWALLIYAGFVVLFIAIFFLASSSMKESDAYKTAVTKLTENEEVTQLLSTPITTGSPSGSFESNTVTGKADFAFSAEGPNGKGMVYLDAIKDQGEWVVKRLEFKQDGKNQRINLDE